MRKNWSAISAAIGFASVLPASLLAAGAERNLVANPSFEIVYDGKPANWTWRPLRAGATLAIDDSAAHSGERSIRISNTTAKAPHVYSLLCQDVTVLPKHTYTLSCYVRSDAPGAAWIGGGPRWRHRFHFPRTGQKWRRVAGTFTTDPGQTSFRILILTESPTKALWVDDVQLELGDQATPFAAALPLEPGQTILRVTPVEMAKNLIPNPSFEVVDGNRPKHWMWDKRNTDATMTVDDSSAHSGKYSVKFTNGTAFHAQVYGWFGLISGVEVKPNTPYTISAFVKSGNPGIAWIGGGRGWRIRLQLPRTDGRWMRVTRTFQTNKDETHIPFMIITESPTEGFWVDDVKLEEGTEATPFLTPETATRPQIDLAPRQAAPKLYRGRPINPYWAPSRWPPRESYFAGDEFWADGYVYAPAGAPADAVRVRLVDARGERIAQATKPLALKAAAASLEFGCYLGDQPNSTVRLTAELLRGRQMVARSEETIHIYTRRGITAEIDRDERLAARLKPLTAALEAKGEGAYSRVALTVLENFVPYARGDLQRHRPGRAWDAAWVMERMARRAIEQSEAVLAGRRPGLRVPRYVTSPIRIVGPSFMAKARWEGEKRLVERPIFFVGYGHFGSVRRDVEKFPGYGVNMIQIEFGPRSVLVSENRTSDAAVRAFLKVCDRAAKAGVAVNLLLSPHYFPSWALKKWPHLKDCSGGFFRYCVHAPEARAVLEKSLRYVIPRIKDHPALHSVCLSNEPINTNVWKCPYVRRMWHEWLRRRHGGLAALNRRWRSHYKSFDEIPVPKPDFKPGALTYDFVRFNQEQFAAFHQWMADVIHSVAPDLPMHAKIMMGAHFRRSLHGVWSVSPELFARLSQINGNDCGRWYRRRGREWASNWLVENMAYDFQRSMADKPIFNSENHLITDRDHDVVPPEFCYNVMWQGAVHGQSATTIWVWERTFNPTASAAGSIMHRPDCVEAVGRACLDLNRLAPEVTAIQNLKPRIVLFWSLASVVQGDEHYLALRRAYEALNFIGLPIGFVTERQLERYAAGGETPLPLRTAKVVIAPSVTHASDRVLAGLRRFLGQGGRVVRLGECFGADEYGFPRAAAPVIGEAFSTQETGAALLTEFEKRLPRWHVARRVRVVDSAGAAAWGIELRAARLGDAWILNLCNHTRRPQSVELRIDGRPVVAARDLLRAEALGRRFSLPPLGVRLVRVSSKG